MVFFCDVFCGNNRFVIVSCVYVKSMVIRGPTLAREPITGDYWNCYGINIFLLFIVESQQLSLGGCLGLKFLFSGLYNIAEYQF